jgi:DNA-binding NtrC family response regulator
MDRLDTNSLLSSVMQKFVCESAVMRTLLSNVERVSASELPVLITGSTGSGKEVVASLIHQLGSPDNSPFIDVNCSAIPENLIESQLFGHEKGAFTGATTRQDGYFSLAANGVLFLDEIAGLPLWQQTKLLRVLETRKFRPVGGSVNHHFQGRVIAATHVDLQQRVKDGAFREDLYYRLNIVQLQVPDLHQRREDIPYLIKQFAGNLSKPISFTHEALKFMTLAQWKGNVRELKNTVDRISVMSDSELIDVDDVKEHLSVDHYDNNINVQLNELASRLLELDLPNKLSSIEYATIQLALKRAKGNKSAAARLLGVHRKYIERKLGVVDEKLREIEQLRDLATSDMALSDYKKAIKSLRRGLKSLDHCITRSKYDDLKLDLMLKLSACLRNVNGWTNSEVVALYGDVQDLTQKLNTPEKTNSIRFGMWVTQLIVLNLKEALSITASYWREGERINNPNVIAQAAISMANTQFWLGEYDGANVSLGQFIDLYSHDQRIVVDFGHDPFVYYLMFKSLLAFQQGKVNIANMSMNSLMTYVRETSQPFSLATALQACAWLNYKQGQYSKSYDCADELFQIANEQGFPFFIGVAEIFLGHREAVNIDYRQGKRMITDGFREKLNGGKGRLFNSMYGIILADIAIASGNHVEGLEDIESTIATSVETGEHCYLAEELVMRGRLKMLLGQVSSAMGDFYAATMEAESRHSKAAELKATLALADTLYQQGRVTEAKKVLTPVVMRYIEQDNYLDLESAISLLDNVDKEMTIPMFSHR